VRQRTGATRLGDDRAGQLGADAGDLREPPGSGQHGGVWPGAGGGAGAAVGVHPPGGPDLGQVLLDPGGQGGDAGIAEGDLVQQHLRQLPMVVIEHPGQRLDQGVVLGFHPAAGQAGQDVGVALAADHPLIMSCAETVVSLLATADTLISATSSSFSSRCQQRVRSWTRWVRARA